MSDTESITPNTTPQPVNPTPETVLKDPKPSALQALSDFLKEKNISLQVNPPIIIKDEEGGIHIRPSTNFNVKYNS